MSKMLHLGCDSVGLPRGRGFARRLPCRLLRMFALAVHSATSLNLSMTIGRINPALAASSLTRVDRDVL